MTTISIDQRPRRVRLVGSFDASTAREVQEALSRSECCVVDCWMLIAVDSDVLRAFVVAHERAEERGSHLVFLGLSGEPLNQVRLRQLDEILHIA